MGTQPLTDHSPPRNLSDVASCRRWLETLPLTDIAATQGEFAEQLGALSSVPRLTALERLQILETLKETLLFVQNAAARSYAGRPLPLDNGEAKAWAQTAALWEILQTNYGLCLQAYRENDLAMTPYAPLVTLRCLQCIAWRIFDHYCVHREPAATLWHELNALYAYAERQGHSRLRVHDTFTQRDPESSCTEVYVQALLVQLANPYALTAQQETIVRRWAERWAGLVELARDPLPPGQIPPLAVDLAGSTGAGPVTDAATPTLRYLDLEALAKTLLQTLTLLKQGQSPAQLGLGEDARQPAGEDLLMLLYVQWCRAGTGRTEERFPVEERATVCLGIAAAHHQASDGKPFREPPELAARDKPDRAAPAESARDDGEGWVILNHSASGFLCMLRQPASRMRVSQNQLLALRREAGAQLHLGIVQWVRIDQTDKLLCGVRLFPGKPEAVAVRPSNFSALSGDRYERALVLPAVQVPATPATAVLPAGWFHSGRFVEIFTDGKRMAKLLNLIERGSDFDRGTIAFV